ncbi:MAG: zinc dependent phospholipase C family protein [Clostridia bacterium]|nr:zinc dependent phospholipase C family protein [Clostridia bacterium]
MPAMITHYLLGKRLLPLSGMPAIPNRDAFLLGTQGPDIFFFFRMYPWQPGEKGMPTGVGLHGVRSSLLVDTLRTLLNEAPAEDRPILKSYILGFLSHYAADRTIHPFVLYWQEDLMKQEPLYAKSEGPYHYRIESALDTLLLHHDSGEYVTAFSLKSLVPKPDAERDRILAWFYHELLLRVLDKEIPEKQLRKLTGDFRHSMGWMTDRNEWKGKAIRFYERTTKSGAFLSSLLRTKEVERYDYINSEHRVWLKNDNEVSREDFYELCDDTVEVMVSVLKGFEDGLSGAELTNDIDFAGTKFHEEVTADETDREL